MCLRFALRALALAGRFPWFAFFNFFPDFAISIFLFTQLCNFDWNPFSAVSDQSLIGAAF